SSFCFFFQAEDGIRGFSRDWSSDVCSSDLGRANSAVGPNNSLLSEGPISWGGDQDLEQALDINNTVNATVLEFDFIAQTNKISRSEERRVGKECRCRWVPDH